MTQNVETPLWPGHTLLVPQPVQRWPRRLGCFPVCLQMPQRKRRASPLSSQQVRGGSRQKGHLVHGRVVLLLGRARVRVQLKRRPSPRFVQHPCRTFSWRHCTHLHCGVLRAAGGPKVAGGAVCTLLVCPPREGGRGPCPTCPDPTEVRTTHRHSQKEPSPSPPPPPPPPLPSRPSVLQVRAWSTVDTSTRVVHGAAAA